MAQLIGRNSCENSNVSVELKQGPETSAKIREAFNEGKTLDFMMLPWVSAGNEVGMIPVLIGDWPILNISVSAVKCVSVDGMQWIMEGTIMRDLTQKAKETASKNVDLVSPDDLTCFYAGAYVVLYYDVLTSSGGVFLVKTGKKHERFFMLPQLPQRSIPDLWESAVVPQALQAYDLAEKKVVEVEDYSPYTLAKMPPPGAQEDQDTQVDSNATQPATQGAGAGNGSEGDSKRDSAAKGGALDKSKILGVPKKK